MNKDMESTASLREWRDYCRWVGISGYSGLRKAELVRLIEEDSIFPFSRDLFAKPRRARELRVKCEECGGTSCRGICTRKELYFLAPFQKSALWVNDSGSAVTGDKE